MISAFYVFGQSNPVSQENTREFVPNIIPPSPSVANLMKFEEVPVNNYTGVPEISIPITTIKTSVLDLPVNVTLKYHTYNAKSDSKAGEVGLGWSLITGGTISRTVRSGVDEAIGTGNDGIQVGMYFDEHATYSYADQKNYFHAIIDNINGVNISKSVFEAHYKNKFDTQYDIYQYNFANYTGRFILKKLSGGLQVVKLDKNNLKIEVNHSFVSNNLTTFEPQSFRITDDKGNSYMFDVLEKSTSSNFSHSEGILMSMSTNTNGINRAFNSAFHLSNIKNSEGTDLVYFNYDPNPIDVSTIERSQYYGSYIYTIPNDPAIDQNKTLLPKITETHSNTIISKIRKLNEIDILGKGKINFSYEYGREDTNYHLLTAPPILKKIIVKDYNSHLQEMHELSYVYKKSGPYKRLFLENVTKSINKGSGFISVSNQSLNYNEPLFSSINLISQPDYFFSCENMDCTSVEVLKSITYPTKGNVEFVFEANTYSYEPDVENWSPNMVEINNFDENYLNWDSHNSVVNFNLFSSTVYKYAFKLNVAATVKIDINSSEINQYGWSLNYYRKDGTNYVFVGNYTNAVLPDPNDPPAFITRDFTPGEYYFTLTKVNPGNSGLFSSSFYVSYKVKNNHNYKFLFDNRGIRTKTINYYGKLGTLLNPATPTIVKNFYYHDLLDAKKSTGALVSPRPVFTYDDYFQAKLRKTPITYYNFNNVVQKSSTKSFLQSQKTKGSDVGYQFVTVYETDKGKSIYQYSSPIDHPNPELPSTLPPFRGTSNHDHLRGNLLNAKNYNNQGVLLTEDKYVYAYDFSEIKTGIIIFPSNYLYGGEHSNHEAFLNWKQNYGIYYGSLDDLGSLTYEIMKEPIGTSNMVKEEKIQYFNGQANVKNITKNDYNSRDYLIEKKITYSTGEQEKTNYKYAHEKGNQKLINANMIGIPLETIVTKKIDSLDSGKIISHLETLYENNNHKFPTSIRKFNLQTSLPLEEITYDRYDSKGNLLQYTLKNGITTLIIWGYNQTQPIAKLEGLDYGLPIDTYTVDIVAFSNIDASPPQQTTPQQSEQNLIDKLDEFRKKTELSGYQITTYTYDPLIGVRSITPPSGIREYYFYDTANRLEFIKTKDEAGNFKILKEFKYNYKQ